MNENTKKLTDLLNVHMSETAKFHYEYFRHIDRVTSQTSRMVFTTILAYATIGIGYLGNLENPESKELLSFAIFLSTIFLNIVFYSISEFISARKSNHFLSLLPDLQKPIQSFDMVTEEENFQSLQNRSDAQIWKSYIDKMKNLRIQVAEGNKGHNQFKMAAIWLRIVSILAVTFGWIILLL